MGKGERSAGGRQDTPQEQNVEVVCEEAYNMGIEYLTLCVFDRELEPLQGRGYSPDESAEPVFEELFKDSKEE